MAHKAAWAHTSTLVRGTHEFRIVGVAIRSSTITSGDFHAGGHTWALSCGFDDDGHLASISLELLSYPEDDVVALANIRIEDPLRRRPAAVWRSEGAHTFPYWNTDSDNRSWELSVPAGFHGREERYVIDDCLTIHCSVDVLQEECREVRVENIATVGTPPGISKDLGKLLLLDESSEVGRPDVTFVVEEAEIQAHKLVLAMRSPVFAAEFRWQTEEGERIRIDDMSASIFRSMLRFIYTDELPIKRSNDVSGASKVKYAEKRREAMALDLLVAADRYDLDRLRLMCENILSESIDVASVMPMLMVVHGRHSCRQLEASCIEYLVSDPDVYAAVKATEEYKELKERCSSFLLDVTEKVATVNMFPNSRSLSTSSSKMQPQKSASTHYSRMVVEGTHEFRIPQFFAMQRSSEVGESIDSCKFQVGGYDWMLRVYPLLPHDHAKLYISIYLHLLTNPRAANIRTSLTFRIGDPSGKFPPTKLSVETSFDSNTTKCACPEFITWESAKSQYLAHDGSLTIRCNIAVAKDKYTSISNSTTSIKATVPVPPSNIAWHLEQLLVTEQGSDITFLVEETQIRAHSLVIATRSPVLYEAVAAASNGDHVIQIDNMKAATFKVILHFIYTDELPPIEDLVSKDAKDVRVIARDILTAASRFCLQRTKAMFENILADLVSKENVLSTLRIARQHRCSKLEDYCIEFILMPHMTKDVMKTIGLD
ncbi:BTB/POZ and MATH domain-containing protein 1-like [Lolium rigidum]|uniref:BTB/POZ and MATH domain-containing protein 1-like n=1 Tax=Lolium rigidum TaxID=89674 RepID=UPI001F5D3F95|nr:BTB/POZ and MATH domain-containing protein 1-like [Lolium rigidum]